MTAERANRTVIVAFCSEPGHGPFVVTGDDLRCPEQIDYDGTICGHPGEDARLYIALDDVVKALGDSGDAAALVERHFEGGAMTSKEQMVLDYMRGNGQILTHEGWQHLVRRGSFTNRGLSQVLSRLERHGLVQRPFPPTHHGLTAEGLRASEASHT